MILFKDLPIEISIPPIRNTISNWLNSDKELMRLPLKTAITVIGNNLILNKVGDGVIMTFTGNNNRIICPQETQAILDKLSEHGINFGTYFKRVDEQVREDLDFNDIQHVYRQLADLCQFYKGKLEHPKGFLEILHEACADNNICKGDTLFYINSDLEKCFYQDIDPQDHLCFQLLKQKPIQIYCGANKPKGSKKLFATELPAGRFAKSLLATQKQETVFYVNYDAFSATFVSKATIDLIRYPELLSVTNEPVDDIESQNAAIDLIEMIANCDFPDYLRPISKTL